MNLHKQAWLWIIVFSLIISGTIIYYGEDVTLLSNREVVVSVNEERMNKAEFQMVLEQVKENYAQMGMDTEELSEEEVKETATEMAVDQLLFLSYAKTIGVDVEEEEMKVFYDEIVANEPEIGTKAELFSMWESEGYGKKEMEEQVKLYLIYDKIYEKYLDEAEATEEELREAYKEYISWIEEVGAPEGEVMTYEEIKGELEEFIVQESAIDRMEKDIDEFKKGSTIEVSI